MPRVLRLAALTLVASATLAEPARCGIAPEPSGPTVATEDTLHAEVPEVLVRAPRRPLEEILDEVAAGEARRDSAIRDLACTVTVRMVRNVTGRGEPTVISEDVTRLYRRKPDQVRAVPLRRWRLEPGRNRARAEAGYDADTSEEILNFAFRPAGRRLYRYRIVGRDLLGDRLVYRIAFEPRSPLDATQPSGVVWIDTNEFVILRQELSFARSPVPLLLKGLDHAVIERTRADGTWVLSRMLVRLRFTLPLPAVGRSADIAVQFTDYAVNRGIEDAVFEGAARR